MLISKTLRLFLDGLGRREEYEHYLKAFQAEDGGCFAALAPDVAGLEQSVDLIAFDLSFLLKLELIPVVLLCGSSAPEMSALLEAHSEVVHRVFMKADEDAKPAVAEAKSKGKVPVLVYTDTSLQEVVSALAPSVFRRVHLLRAQGGLTTDRGDRIGYHWLKGTNRHLIAESEKAVLKVAAHCLQAHPNLHLAVGSPLNLLTELFTVVGAGSVIRPGSTLRCVRAVEEIDQARLKELLVEAFGRPLADTAFFDRVDQFFIEENYRGAALLEPHEAGKYLTKFAVGMQARGEGLALELWNAVSDRHPALFWRSKTGNAINAWYGRQADGRHRIGDWQVYWRGIDPAHISSMIEFAASRPEDFQEPA